MQRKTVKERYLEARALFKATDFEEALAIIIPLIKIDERLNKKSFFT